MSRDSRIALLLLSIFVVVFVVGLTHLFLLRFRVGDVYPPYSSLRADPLGTKIFYESLGRLPDISVVRNYQPLSKLRDFKDTTFLYLGARVPHRMHEDLVEDLERLAAGGGRLVISFYPSTARPRPVREEEREKSKGAGDEEGEEAEPSDGEEPEEGDEDDALERHLRLVSLAERWGVSFDHAELPERYDEPYGSAVAYRTDVENVPDSISWHTTLFFDELDDRWRVVYVRDMHPAIIERQFGAGTIVLSADSFYVSNEAMLRERHPTLLSWLVGPNAMVVCDETHLGISEQPGIMALARRYRLHGFLVGIVVLAGLFVWKNTMSLVPPLEDEAGEAQVAAGRDFTAGLVNLLRRSIVRKDILTVCFEEWKRSFAHGRKDFSEALKRVEEAITTENARPAGERNVVRCYRTISHMLSEERKCRGRR